MLHLIGRKISARSLVMLDASICVAYLSNGNDKDNDSDNDNHSDNYSDNDNDVHSPPDENQKSMVCLRYL